MSTAPSFIAPSDPLPTCRVVSNRSPDWLREMREVESEGARSPACAGPTLADVLGLGHDASDFRAVTIPLDTLRHIHALVTMHGLTIAKQMRTGANHQAWLDEARINGRALAILTRAARKEASCATSQA
jgi:hypothetical protein